MEGNLGRAGARNLEVPMRFFLLSCCLAAVVASPAQICLLGGPSAGQTRLHFIARTTWFESGRLVGGRQWAPLPTNAWWQNLALGGGGLTVNTLPYLVQVSGDALKFGCPNKVVDQNYIFTSMTENLSFRSVQSTPGTDHGLRAPSRQPGLGVRFGLDAHRPRARSTLHDDALQPR